MAKQKVNKRKEVINPTGWKPGRKRAKLIKTDDEKVPAGWKHEQNHPGTPETPVDDKEGEIFNGQASFKSPTDDENDPESWKEKSEEENDGDGPENWKEKPDDENVPKDWKGKPEYEADEKAQKNLKDGPDNENISEGWKEKSEERLLVLRNRMEIEKKRIIDYLDEKKEVETLEVIKQLWESEERKNFKKAVQEESEKKRSVRCEKARLQQVESYERKRPNILLNGWNSWWMKMEHEAECSGRMARLTKRDGKKKIFSDRINPNILLTGWKTWWSRMEAESIREEKSRQMEGDWARSRGYQNNLRKESFVRKFFSTPSSTRRGMSKISSVDRVEANVTINCGQSKKEIQ